MKTCCAVGPRAYENRRRNHSTLGNRDFLTVQLCSLNQLTENQWVLPPIGTEAQILWNGPTVQSPSLTNSESKGSKNSRHESTEIVKL
jgi:hypothetical protein